MNKAGHKRPHTMILCIRKFSGKGNTQDIEEILVVAQDRSGNRNWLQSLKLDWGDRCLQHKFTKSDGTVHAERVNCRVYKLFLNKAVLKERMCFESVTIANSDIFHSIAKIVEHTRTRVGH